MRGRRADPPGLQEAKGNPGRRKRKPSIAERIRKLAEAPAASDDPLAPPRILGLEEFAGAVAIWNEYVPELRRRNIIDRLDRHSMAIFCYYLDRFWNAVTRLVKDGETQRVKTTTGDFMIRDHPAVRHRDDAAKIVFDLSGRFGFTPLDRHKLVREMAGSGAPAGGLFGDDKAEATPVPAEDPNGILGFAGRNAGSPPKPH